MSHSGRHARRAAGQIATWLLSSCFAASAWAQAPLPQVTVAKPVVRQIVEDDEFVGRFEAVDQVAVRSRVGRPAGSTAIVHRPSQGVAVRGW